MTREAFRELVKKGPVLLDGATGTNLQKAGMPVGVCPEQWILENSEVLIDLQKRYVEAGTDILFAPTFTASRIKLKEYGLEDHLEEMNRKLVALSKEAAKGTNALVAGDLTMTGEQLYPLGDLMFEDLKKKKPNHFAVRQYAKFKLAAGKTLKSILVSAGARLAPFDIQEVREITMYDELELDKLGDRKTALFLIMSDTDSTFNFLISMIYTQLFNLLCDKADDVYGGKLPIHVRCLIDECANIGQIPQLEKLVATIRSREISACLVLQTRSQLKAIYKDNADTIVGNMDSQIFLGGSEPTTLKDLSEMLGKETIDAFNTSDTRGNSPSYGTTFQKMGHELLSRDELAVLDGGKCILQLRGVRPFLSDKYDLTQHPNYKLTSDYDPKNTFDIEKYLNRKEKINPNDEFVVIDADSLPSA